MSDQVRRKTDREGVLRIAIRAERIQCKDRDERGLAVWLNSPEAKQFAGKRR